jgi:hypothetical protein
MLVIAPGTVDPTAGNLPSPLSILVMVPAPLAGAFLLTAPVENLSRAIQMSVAPVFLLTGIGALLVMLTNRLGRIIDRSRRLQDQARDQALALSRENRHELQVQKRRMALVVRAIQCSTLTILLVAAVVAVLFLSAVTALTPVLVVVPLFVLAMLSLMAAVLLFLREVQLAAALLQRRF